jgi:hypothetical protein
VERERQPWKDLPQIALTEEGMEIDKRDEQSSNALGSITESREGDSNATAESA